MVSFAGEIVVGQEVRVFGMGATSSHGMPPGGWPGRIVKITPKQVHITYGDRPLTDIFDRSQRIRYGDIARKFRTLPQVALEERHAVAMKVLREAGIRLEDPSRFTIDQVEALAGWQGPSPRPTNVADLLDYHCKQRCGGRTVGGYGAITGPDGAIHAACSPDDPSTRPDCYRRVTEFGEPAGALRDVRPLPVGVEALRLS